MMLLAASAYAAVSIVVTIVCRWSSGASKESFVSTLNSRDVGVKTCVCIVFLLAIIVLLLSLTVTISCSQTVDDACYLPLSFFGIPIVLGILFFTVLALILRRARRQDSIISWSTFFNRNSRWTRKHQLSSYNYQWRWKLIYLQKLSSSVCKSWTRYVGSA